VIREAVILAAGSGRRLNRSQPKGLTPVGGRPLLFWITDALAECGVEIAHLIVSERQKFEGRLGELSEQTETRIAECPDWHLGNGRSAAWAERIVGDGRFFLLMSDHLISAAHLKTAAAMPATTCALATSAAAPWLDVDDATKVRIDASGLIRDIGKDLLSFDGIDTGVFVMTRALFPALEEARQRGEYSLTAGNRCLCRDELLRAAPIGDLRWYDIDTARDLKAAEAWVARSGDSRRVT
jgi:CDP-L-myo-inositol myo-inositolphosphotransferase